MSQVPHGDRSPYEHSTFTCCQVPPEGGAGWCEENCVGGTSTTSTSTSTTSSEDPEGACCKVDPGDGCYISTSGGCGGDGYVWLGEGTNCETDCSTTTSTTSTTTSSSTTSSDDLQGACCSSFSPCYITDELTCIINDASASFSEGSTCESACPDETTTS